jgi:hypothetical protein
MLVFLSSNVLGFLFEAAEERVFIAILTVLFSDLFKSLLDVFNHLLLCNFIKVWVKDKINLSVMVV